MLSTCRFPFCKQISNPAHQFFHQDVWDITVQIKTERSGAWDVERCVFKGESDLELDFFFRLEIKKGQRIEHILFLFFSFFFLQRRRSWIRFYISDFSPFFHRSDRFVFFLFFTQFFLDRIDLVFWPGFSFFAFFLSDKFGFFPFFHPVFLAHEGAMFSTGIKKFKKSQNMIFGHIGVYWVRSWQKLTS